MAVRDREATEARIIDAFGSVVMQDGIDQVGVNAVVKKANVGKDLIYRYFGGLRGIAEAWLRRDEVLISRADVVGDDEAAFAALPDLDKLKVIVRNYMGLTRTRPELRRVLEAELTHENELTRALAHVREEKLEILRSLFDDHNFLDQEGRSLLLLFVFSAIDYLAIYSGGKAPLLGVDFDDEATWARLGDLVELAIDRLWEPAKGLAGDTAATAAIA